MLNLGFAFLASQDWIARAQGALDALSEELGESCAVSVLQGDQVVIVASAASRRIMTGHLAVGARLPAFHSAMGRIQLAGLDVQELRRRLAALRFPPYTQSTIIDRDAILERIREDGARGFSLVDEEFEQGLRSIAAPVVDRRERAIAALNVNAQSNRVTRTICATAFCPNFARRRGGSRSLRIDELSHCACHNCGAGVNFISDNEHVFDNRT